MKNLTDITHILAHPDSSALTLYDSPNFISFKKRNVASKLNLFYFFYQKIISV